MINQNLLLAGDDGYNLTKSLRFRSSASAYLNRTPASSTNRKTWTMSAWVKRGQITNDYPAIFNAGSSAPDVTLRFDGSNDSLNAFLENGGGSSYGLTTTQVFRDPSAWYHIVWACDTTQATASNRLKLYINGVQVTAFATANYPSLNFDTQVNNTVLHKIGYQRYATGYFDGYMAEFNFVDGQQLTPSSFGSTNALTGVWQPAKYTGTYGTNGFYLPFTDTTSTTTLGYDFSGNSNNWTTNNLSLTTGSTYDSMTDVPTLTSATTANYCVLNPLAKLNGVATGTPSNGNLTLSVSSQQVNVGTFALSYTDKWYYEVNVTTASTYDAVGWTTSAATGQGGAWADTNTLALYAANGQIYINGWSGSYSTYTAGDVIGIGWNNGTVSFYKNNTLVHSYTSNFVSTAVVYPVIQGVNNGCSFSANFGQRPFSYTPPTGFVALNTYNLPTSTIVKGNTVMDATLYTGNGTSLSVTNSASFQPDFVWIKQRNGTGYNMLFDSVRGVQKWLTSNDTLAETTGTDNLSAFNSNGFTVLAGGFVNPSGGTVVGWQWKAGGTAVTNTAGSISSQVSANTTSGFSVVTYTGTGSAATIGHGLGVAPNWVIVKQRNASADWVMRSNQLAGNDYTLILDNTSAQTSYSPSVWNNTAPTSSVFSIGTNSAINTNGNTYVAYCWSEIAGFSKFGSYTGNGSSDGSFIYLGFRPKYIMVKKSSGESNWQVLDSSRSPYNLAGEDLLPNSSDAEKTIGDGFNQVDMLSNGFKIRNTNCNDNGGTYIFACFAENPFKNALAR